jgi:hypothetical protein
MRFVVPAIALGLLASGPVSAQSLYGPGGLFLQPTASFSPKGTITPGFLLLPQHNPRADATRFWLSSSVAYAVSPDVELGISALKVTNWEKDASFGGFGRFRLLRETGSRPAAAVGFATSGGGDVDTRKGFLALRKGLGSGARWPVTAHLGVEYVDIEDGLNRHEFRPYGGLELGLSSRLSFIAEARFRQNQEFGTPLALTFAYRVTNRWRMAVSWANNGLSDEPKFGFGAGYSLGARR